ncbi:MAG: hypothetical protein B6D59_05010 [Campylobacteraceae bacterium 4484_4]|nr:MAG: hypothetical protein B6D59_05010 [Campylobacteraceae bacterium 4484_4]
MPDKTERNWSMYLHFSQLASMLVPILGLIIPIILWQLKKEESSYIDANGKAVLNWIISAIIYYIVGYLLIPFGIGIFIILAVGILSIIFAIIGGLKANNGEVWPYPLSIGFLK